MSSEILNFTEAITVDESIEKYEFKAYESVNGTNLNSPGTINIDIGMYDVFAHPAESYLLIEGKLTKANGDAYANDDVIALTNNGLMHLFSNITYKLSDQQIESLNHPGQATTMIGMLKYPDGFSKAQGLNQLWSKDTTATAALADNTGFAIRQAYLIKKPDPKGTFSFVVPLKHIFGFCDDYDKIVYGFKHTLALVRKTDDDAIFRLPTDAGAHAAGKVSVDKLSWFMPQILPADSEKFQLYKSIESKVTVPVPFRSRHCESITVPQSTSFNWRLSVRTPTEKPRYILVGFQTNRRNNQTENTSIFDHCNLNNIYVTVNNQRYPEADYNLSFPNQKFSRAYYEAARFSEKFYGMDPLITQSNITPADFKDLFPIMVFDVSKQSERLKYASVEMQIQATFHQNVPAGTEAYAVVISDQMIKFTSDGSKMYIVMK